MTAPDFRLIDELDDATREAVQRELREHNQAHNAALDRPENAARPLNVVAFELADGRSGRVVGGLIGETRLAWLKVSILAVRADARLAGVGRRLTELAETEALARGCRHAYVDTMDYQAPDFYARLGYALAGRIDDWDSHGHAKLFFVKRLERRLS